MTIPPFITYEEVKFYLTDEDRKVILKVVLSGNTKNLDVAKMVDERKKENVLKV